MTKTDEARALIKKLEVPLTNINTFMVVEALKRGVEVGATDRRPRIIFMHGSDSYRWGNGLT